MLQTLLGAGSGILTGLLGTALQALFRWLGDRQRFAHDLAMRRMDIEAMQTEHTLRLREAEAKYAGEAGLSRIDLEKVEAQAGAEIRAASYGNDRATYWTPQATGWVGVMLALVDGFRGFMRPAITAYLLIATSIIAFGLQQTIIASSSLSPEQTYQQVILSVIFLTETAVTWWFGSRALTRKAA